MLTAKLDTDIEREERLKHEFRNELHPDQNLRRILGLPTERLSLSDGGAKLRQHARQKLERRQRHRREHCHGWSHIVKLLLESKRA